MPITKLRPTKRASAAIAAVMALAMSVGGVWYARAPDGRQYPTAVVLAVEHIIKNWEGLRLVAYRDFYLPMAKCAAPAFEQAPVPVQAAMLGGGFNFGVGGWCGSTAARMIRAKNWRAACDAQTAWNRAGGQVVQGLVNRREMGDASRLGEGELCVTGLR